MYRLNHFIADNLCNLILKSNSPYRRVPLASISTSSSTSNELSIISIPYFIALGIFGFFSNKLDIPLLLPTNFIFHINFSFSSIQLITAHVGLYLFVLV